MELRRSIVTLVAASLSGCAGGEGAEASATAGTSSSAAATGEVTSEAGSTTGDASGASAGETIGGTSGTTGASTSSTSAADTDTSTTTGGDPARCDPQTFCAGATEEGMCRQALEIGGGMLGVWANLPLEPAPGEDDCHAGIERLVIVQHGNGRTAWSYFEGVRNAATIAGVESTTLIVAPHFPAPVEAAEGFHSWSPLSSGWKSGDDSLTSPPLSSFAAIDRLVLDFVLASPHYPALKEVVVTGHSAGGQFTQRYAIATAVDEAPEAAGVDFRFVVLNPSSYLYLDPYRWDGVGVPPAIDFAVPSGTGCDAESNEYKYGLDGVPTGHYVEAHLDAVPAAYLGRDVTYLLGEADTLQDSDLDTSCPAMLQGAHRLERGEVFAAYLDARFPAQDHALVTVPGVGHSQSAMYGSPAGVGVLFP